MADAQTCEIENTLAKLNMESLNDESDLETVVERKIPSPCREPNPRNSIVHDVAHRYTD
jgi:hypothetical protein